MKVARGIIVTCWSYTGEREVVVFSLGRRAHWWIEWALPGWFVRFLALIVVLMVWALVLLGEVLGWRELFRDFEQMLWGPAV